MSGHRASSSSNHSRSELIDKGKRAGGKVIIDAAGISSFDVEAVVKELNTEIVGSKVKYSRSDIVGFARHKGPGKELRVVVDPGSPWTSSFDVDDFLKNGLHVVIPSSNTRFSPSDMRGWAGKGPITVICDDKRLSSFDLDDIIKKQGGAVFYTSKVSFSASEIRGWGTKGRIEVFDDAKKLSSFDKDDIVKHKGIVH